MTPRRWRRARSAVTTDAAPQPWPRPPAAGRGSAAQRRVPALPAAPVRVPQCGAPNTPGELFCGECGAPLAAPAPEAAAVAPRAAGSGAGALPQPRSPGAALPPTAAPACPRRRVLLRLRRGPAAAPGRGGARRRARQPRLRGGCTGRAPPPASPLPRPAPAPRPSARPAEPPSTPDDTFCELSAAPRWGAAPSRCRSRRPLLPPRLARRARPQRCRSARRDRA